MDTSVLVSGMKSSPDGNSKLHLSTEVERRGSNLRVYFRMTFVTLILSTSELGA